MERIQHIWIGWYGVLVLGGAGGLVTSLPAPAASWDLPRQFLAVVSLIAISVGLGVIIWSLIHASWIRLRQLRAHRGRAAREPFVDSVEMGPTEPAIPIAFGGVEPGFASLKRLVGDERVAAGSNYVPPNDLPVVPKVQISPIQMIWVHVRNDAEHPIHVAKDVLAIVELSRIGGTEKYKFRGRWRESKERWQVESWQQIPDLVDVGPGQFFTLDIAFKYVGESLAYGVNTKSTEMARDWRYAAWTLRAGKWLAKVTVNGTNTTKRIGRFEISNPGSGDLTVSACEGPHQMEALEATRDPNPFAVSFDLGQIGYQASTAEMPYTASGTAVRPYAAAPAGPKPTGRRAELPTVPTPPAFRLSAGAFKGLRGQPCLAYLNVENTTSVQAKNARGRLIAVEHMAIAARPPQLDIPLAWAKPDDPKDPARKSFYGSTPVRLNVAIGGNPNWLVPVAAQPLDQFDQGATFIRDGDLRVGVEVSADNLPPTVGWFRLKWWNSIHLGVIDGVWTDRLLDYDDIEVQDLPNPKLTRAPTPSPLPTPHTPKARAQ